MSSILRALKKLEEEKTARTPEALKIDKEILKSGAPPRFPYGTVSLVAVLFLAGGVSLTYFSMKNNVPTASPSPSKTEHPAPAASSNPLQPLGAQDVSDKQSEGVIEVIPQGNRVNSVFRREPIASVSTVPPDSRQPRPEKHKLDLPPQKPASDVSAQTAPTPAVVPANTRRTPILKVDGIAFREGGGENVAVVNGVAVTVGEVVEGAKIEEIGKDRIRFSYGSEKFEVGLGKSSM